MFAMCIQLHTEFMAIINNQEELEAYVNNLDDNPDYLWYLCLAQRSKYTSTQDNLLHKIKDVFIKRDVCAKHQIIPTLLNWNNTVFEYPETLVVYITPNPRSKKLSLFQLNKLLSDALYSSVYDWSTKIDNPVYLALNAVYQSKSQGELFDVDIDGVIEYDVLKTELGKILDLSAVKFVQTRGGFHCLITVEKMYLGKTWYTQIRDLKLPGCKIEMKGKNNLLPLPGTTQGGFTPKIIKSNK